MIDAYMLQGAQNLINFTRSMSPGHTTHSTMKIAYLWWRFCDGRSQCPLQHPSPTITITDSIWFTKLKQFIHTRAIRIHMDSMMYPLLQQKDRYIMDLVYNRNYTNKIISNINQCCLYLHALTLSNIVTVDSKYIEMECYLHRSARSMQVRHNLTVNVSKPNKSMCFYWKSFIQHVTTYKSQQLLSPLGDWIVSSDDIRWTYPTYHNKDNLYTRTTSTFTQRHIQQRIMTPLQKLPDDVIPCVNAISGVIPREYTKTPTPCQSKSIKTETTYYNFLTKSLLSPTPLFICTMPPIRPVEVS
jgi:hypothetical protein